MPGSGKEMMLVQPNGQCSWLPDQGAQGGTGGRERRYTQPPFFLEVAFALDFPYKSRTRLFIGSEKS